MSSEDWACLAIVIILTAAMVVDLYQYVNQHDR